MKEILDTIILILFVFMAAMFIIGFNRQQIQKHKDKLNDIEKKQKDKLDE